MDDDQGLDTGPASTPAPPSSAAPSPGIRPYPPGAYAIPPAGVAPRRPEPAPSTAIPNSARVGPKALAIALAVVAAVTAWLPWFKLPGASLFTLSGSGRTRTLNAWDVRARYLWSFRSPQSGPELGWIIVGLALLIVVLGFVGDAAARTAGRVLAGLEVAIVALFLVQLNRTVDNTPFHNVVDLGVTDFAGVGVYLLLVVSLVLVVLPRD